jgi:primosomal protein N''
MAEEYIDKVKQDKETSKIISEKIIILKSQSLSTQAATATELTKMNVVLTRAIDELGDEMANMDEEIEDKNNKINYLTNKIGITEKAFSEEFSKLNIAKQDIDRKTRVWNRMKRRIERHSALQL